MSVTAWNPAIKRLSTIIPAAPAQPNGLILDNMGAESESMTDALRY